MCWVAHCVLEGKIVRMKGINEWIFIWINENCKSATLSLSPSLNGDECQYGRGDEGWMDGIGWGQVDPSTLVMEWPGTALPDQLHWYSRGELKSKWTGDACRHKTCCTSAGSHVDCFKAHYLFWNLLVESDPTRLWEPFVLNCGNGEWEYKLDGNQSSSSPFPRQLATRSSYSSLDFSSFLLLDCTFYLPFFFMYLCFFNSALIVVIIILTVRVRLKL